MLFYKQNRKVFMKKIIKLILVIFTAIMLTGCGKDYNKLSYTKYNEYFKSKDGYVILDKTSNYDYNITRYLEAGNGNVQVFFTEYQKTEDAKKEIEDLYKNQKNYKFKEKDNYTYVKNTKGTYFKLYRVDNVVINAVADKKYKKEVNKVLKDLGYQFNLF